MTLSIKDFPISKMYYGNKKEYLTYISWKDLENIMGEELYKEFGKFMIGQTCFAEGAYECDVENFFRPKSRRFFD